MNMPLRFLDEITAMFFCKQGIDQLHFASAGQFGVDRHDEPGQRHIHERFSFPENITRKHHARQFAFGGDVAASSEFC